MTLNANEVGGGAPTGKYKSAMRLEALARRGRVELEDAARHAEAAARAFMADIAPADPVTVALYWPIRRELDTRPLIDRLLAAGHTVCLPAMLAPDTPLTFRAWDGAAELTDNGFGTMAPGESAPAAAPDIMVMPLAGFDAQGNRLGYGKGYYDRTIANLPRRPILCGYAFSVQQVDDIPAQRHDVPMDMIVTEQGVTRFVAAAETPEISDVVVEPDPDAPAAGPDDSGDGAA